MLKVKQSSCVFEKENIKNTLTCTGCLASQRLKHISSYICLTGNFDQKKANI